jgi:hypothetical protein
MRNITSSIALGLSIVSVVLFACSDDDPPSSPPPTTARGTEATGQACTAAAQCYTQLEGGTLKGEPQCLDRVPGGYCTHLCTKDEDCCAVPGECRTGFKQVCAPFESTGKMMCFLSCEAGDLHAAPDAGAGAPVLEESAYCQAYAGTAFGCRSTGGGKDNRKVCVP